jgi:hypothetical protein
MLKIETLAIEIQAQASSGWLEPTTCSRIQQPSCLVRRLSHLSGKLKVLVTKRQQRK